MTKYTNLDFFEKIDNHEKSYWLGFLATDGSITKNQPKVRLALSIKDKNHIDKFSKIFNIQSKISYNTSNFIEGLYEYCYCQLYNQKIYNDLIRIGFTSNKTYTGYYKIINSIPKSLYNSFILGLLDGDGSVFLSKQWNHKIITISFSSKDKQIIKWIKYILENTLNINKNKVVGNDFYRISWSGYQVKKISDWLYKDSKIFLERKKQIIDNYFQTKVKIYSLSNFRGVSFDNYRDKWVSKIMYKGKRYFLGRYEEKKLAALAYDLFIIHLNLNIKKINLDESIEYYKKIKKLYMNG